MNFPVNQPNLENMQQYLSNEKNRSSTNNGDGPKWWSIPSGMSSIRILPPWSPQGMIALAVNMHPIEYQEKDMKYKKYNWTCVRETFGKPCKICEGLQELKNAGVDTAKWEASRRQFYMNAIVMYDPIYQADIQSGKKPEDASGVAPGTHVLVRIPKQIYDWVLAQITNPMVGDITSLTNGIDVYITKEGSGLGTKYTPTLSPNGRTPVPNEYLEKITALYDLDEIFSTGFDDEMISRLVTYLKNSAGAIQQNMPNVVQGMAGYNPVVPPAPTQAMPNMVPPQTPGYPPMSPNSVPPFSMGNPAPQGVAPSPYASMPNNPVAPVAPSSANFMGAVSPTTTYPSNNSSAAQPSPQESLPNCFGNYNPGNVTCVVCPHEISCSQKSNK